LRPSGSLQENKARFSTRMFIKNKTELRDFKNIIKSNAELRKFKKKISNHR
jgi:hypothetical protein